MLCCAAQERQGNRGGGNESIYAQTTSLSAAVASVHKERQLASSIHHAHAQHDQHRASEQPSYQRRQHALQSWLARVLPTRCDDVQPRLFVDVCEGACKATHSTAQNVESLSSSNRKRDGVQGSTHASSFQRWLAAMLLQAQSAA
jgi:hypothetical protein